MSQLKFEKLFLLKEKQIMSIKTAMVLAAGRGTRMRHLTDDKPKPLVQIAGTSLLGHILQKVKKQGITNVIINTCYKGEMIKEEVANQKDISILFSDEETALETGGGVKKALSKLISLGGENGFFVLNADPLWTEPHQTLLNQLQEAWNPEIMDILLAVVPIEKAYGDVPDGNYFIENGTLRRKKEHEHNIPYLFMGIQIIHPRIFNTSLPDAFSLRDLYDKAQKEKRLAHIIFDGNWFHVGTPEAVKETEKLFAMEKNK